MVKTAAATKAPNRATVEESWMTAEESLSVAVGLVVLWVPFGEVGWVVGWVVFVWVVLG